jgi:cellulose 1,4-beta-cellobiosidase
VESDFFPKLALYMVFDNGNAETGDFSHRVAYGTDGSYDPVEQRAYNAFANTAALGGSGPAADTTPPSTQRDLTALVQADGKVRLTWGVADDDVAVVSYEVLRDGEPLATTDALTSGGTFTDAAPGRGVTRTYAVRAVDSSGNVGDTGDPVVVPVPVVDISAPTRPTSRAVALVSGQPRLTWNAASDDVGVVAYDVLRNGAAVASTNALSFADATAHQGRTHTWAVRARDAAGNVGPASSSVRRTLPDTTPPSAPQGFTVTRSGTRATLRWQAATDNVAVTGYWVYRGTTRVAQLGASARSYAVTSLRSGTTYSFRVAARDAAGNLGTAASANG